MSARKPCSSCPWRVDQDAGDIPNFSLDLAERLRETCGEPGNEAPVNAPRFACHQSHEGREVDCAGWLAAVGHHHLGVRLRAMLAQEPLVLPDEGWPRLHGSFQEVLEKLRATA
jgi:hypothetical protein